MTFPSQGAPQPGNQGYPGVPAQPGYVPNQQAGYSQAPQNYSGGVPTPGYPGGTGYPGMSQVPQKKSKVGKVLLILGAVFVVVGIAIGAFTATMWSSLSLESSPKVGSEPQVVTIAENKAKLLYLPMAPSKGRKEASKDSENGCNILAPDGKVDFEIEGNLQKTIAIAGKSYISIFQLGGTGRANGDYIVRCADPGYILDAETQSKMDDMSIGFFACGAAITFGVLTGVMGGTVARITQRK